MVATALGVVYLVWGSTYLGIRITVEDLPPLTAMGWRFVTAGLVLGLVLAVRRGRRVMQVTRRELAACAVMGLLLPAFGNGLVSIAENRGAPSGLTALLIAAVPLWVVTYRFTSGDRPARQTLVGVLVGFGGLTALVASAGIDGDVPIAACAIVVLAGLCWSFGSWSSPRLGLPANALVAVSWEMLFGGVALLVMATVAGEPLMMHASVRSWLAWGYLVSFGSLLAYTAYAWLLSVAPISLVATYAYVNPVVAVFLGWVVVGESVTIAIVVAGAVVVAAVAIVVTSERADANRRPSRPAEADREPVDGSDPAPACTSPG